jgi:hypothetical protein
MTDRHTRQRIQELKRMSDADTMRRNGGINVTLEGNS